MTLQDSAGHYDRVRDLWHHRYTRDMSESERADMARQVNGAAMALGYSLRYRDSTTGTVWAPVVNVHIPTGTGPGDYCDMPTTSEVLAGTGTWGRRRIGTA